MKKPVLIATIALLVVLAIGEWYFLHAWWALLVIGPLLGLVIYDLT